MTQIEPIELAKKKAAYAGVDEFIKDKMIVGIGSGSTVSYVVERLIQRVKDEKLKLVCIPTSFQSTQLIVEGKLTLGDLSRYPVIDVDIDGADEVDAHLQLIKGGGGCQTQEKIVASNSKSLIIVADYRKESKILGEQWKKGVPIEVIPCAYAPLITKFSQMGGKSVLRMGTNKAGPVVTDNGNFILDVDFGLINNPDELEKRIKLIPGVVETGLFINMAKKAFFGHPDGTVTTREK